MKWFFVIMMLGIPFLALSQVSGQFTSEKSKVLAGDTISLADHSFLPQFNFLVAGFELKNPNPLSIYTPKHHVNGMFCKMEYRIETRSQFAPRFRLGSVNYTDWREGKKPMYMRYWN